MIHNKLPLVITIDGTAGSGKGTISKKLAKKLGWHFLDSGALYRALGLLWICITYTSTNISTSISDSKDLYFNCLDLNCLDLNSLNLNNLNLNYLDQFKNNKNNKNFINKICAYLDLNFQLIMDLKENFWLDLAKNMSLKFFLKEDQEKFLLKYKEASYDVTNIIRTEFCGDLASRLAVIPKVRLALLDQQKQYLQEPGLIADGRAMGTEVFSQAKLKFFLDADPKIRANRRYMQLKEIGVGGTLHNRIDELSGRDLRDSRRKIAPLKPATDAIIIDTTKMTIDEVFDIVMYRVNLIV